jgi:PAS domain S-box-containing protein
MERPHGIAGSLSERELQLLVLASQGCTDNAIAHRLGISLATVGTYWGRVRIKLGPLNRTELVAVFLQEQSQETLSLLRAENQRLVDVLEEKAKTEAMLKTSLELFRGLLETAPDAILLVREDGIVQLANEQAELIFGYGPNEMLGMEVEALVPERYRETHVGHRAAYCANPVKRRMGEHRPTFARRKDGTEFPMATALSATETGNGLLITCIVRDLTEVLQGFWEGGVQQPSLASRKSGD